MAKALVILSGGQDSTTCLYWAKARFGQVTAVTFDYGQRHSREIAAAQKIADLAGAGHYVCPIPSILDGRSPLTNPSEQLEQYENHAQMEKVIGDRVELTFVPMRNALFLTIAANHAVCRDIYDLVTGVCQADNANYPDCRREFIGAQETTINEALGLGASPGDKRPSMVIHTPLMDLPKDESIKLALTLPGCYAALGYSHTAYDGSYPPTGHDHATVLRAHGFETAGVPDPLVVRAYWEHLLPELPKTENYARFMNVFNMFPHLQAWQLETDVIMRRQLNALEAAVKAHLGIH